MFTASGVSLVVLLALLMLLDIPLLVDERDEAVIVCLFWLGAAFFTSLELTTSDEEELDVHDRFESANESSFCLSQSEDLGEDWEDDGSDS